jgi:hypothetical protein
VITGSCLCGAVAYEIDALSGPVGHCHCRTCRKAHSAAFSTTERAMRSAFRLTRGEAGLRSFESSPGKRRFFCDTCGSHVFAAWGAQAEVILRIGSVDQGEIPAPVAHVFTGDKAA